MLRNVMICFLYANSRCMHSIPILQPISLESLHSINSGVLNHHDMKLRLSEKKKFDRMWTIPRAMPKGECRPGFLPVRLCMLMEVMLHAFNFHGGFECVDLFAGRCAISKAYVAKGLRACALDICLDPQDDARLQLKKTKSVVEPLKNTSWIPSHNGMYIKYSQL